LLISHFAVELAIELDDKVTQDLGLLIVANKVYK